MLLSSPSLSLSTNPFQLKYQTLKNPNFSPKSLRFPKSAPPRPRQLLCISNRSENAEIAIHEKLGEEEARIDGSPNLGRDGMSVGVGSPSLPLGLGMYRVGLGDQAFFLLAFIACTTSIAFTSLVIAAVPTLYAMRRAAISLAKLADTAREELPSTMAAVRLSGMEISDLTLELSDLSQEISDGVNKSAQAVQAAEAGIRQIGAIAHSRTMSMIQERASLPSVSLQPVVAGAARKTSDVVGQAKRTFMNFISRGSHDCYTSDSGDSGDESAENIQY